MGWVIGLCTCVGILLLLTWGVGRFLLRLSRSDSVLLCPRCQSDEYYDRTDAYVECTRCQHVYHPRTGKPYKVTVQTSAVRAT